MADRLAAGEAGLAVGRHRELEQHLRPAFAHAADVAGVGARRRLGAEPDLDRDAAARAAGRAPARDLRIGILQRRHHARDAGADDGVGAGRRLAVMRARLERHVERGAARGLAGALERLGLGMRPAAGLRPAAAEDDAVLDDHRADRRIGPGAAEPAPAERERKLHEARDRAPGRVAPGPDRRGRGLRFGRAHLRALAGFGSSSPVSSASACSKSFGSRKLR